MTLAASLLMSIATAFMYAVNAIASQVSAVGGVALVWVLTLLMSITTAFMSAVNAIASQVSAAGGVALVWVLTLLMSIATVFMSAVNAIASQVSAAGAGGADLWVALVWVWTLLMSIATVFMSAVNAMVGWVSPQRCVPETTGGMGTHTLIGDVDNVLTACVVGAVALRAFYREGPKGVIRRE